MIGWWALFGIHISLLFFRLSDEEDLDSDIEDAIYAKMYFDATGNPQVEGVLFFVCMSIFFGGGGAVYPSVCVCVQGSLGSCLFG